MDKKKTITPNEINKYLYCPYQWYYERYYGRKEIRERYKIRNEKYNYTDSAKSNFKKGLDFHNNYMENEDKNQTIKKLMIVVIVIIVTVLVYYYLVMY